MRSPLHRVGVALGVSLALHGLAAMALWGVGASARGRSEDTRPVTYHLHEPAPVATAVPTPRASATPAPMPSSVGVPAMPNRTAIEAFDQGATTIPEIAWPSPGRDVFAVDAMMADAPVIFAGLGAERAASVVYVVDGSGPMVSSLPMVFDELRRSLRSLDASQQFAIVIFRDRSMVGGGSRVEEFRPRLVPANEASINAAASWLTTIHAEGASNPSDGLRRAIAHRPEVVFLLARSIRRSGEYAQWGAGREAILAELERLNPPDPRTGRRLVQIKTLQFIEEDPTGTMQAIGERHGGEGGYRVLRLEEVGGR